MSTTKNLGLFKHDNPATNITDQFNVDKALNQNWDKTDEAFGKDRDRLDLLEASNTIYDFKGKVDTLANLQLKTKTQGDVWYCEEDSTYYTYTGTDWIPVNLNLKLGVIDELKAKTIKCLQEVETPTPVSGTSIDLSDSADAKITELKISGNSRQETRSGKNKIEITKTTTTVNGCTHTIKDGTDTLSGTSTAWANLIIYSFTGDGKTYTLSGSPTSSKNIFISAHDNTQNKDLAISKNGSTGTFIAPSENSIDIIICVGSNITLENELFKPQLELGSTATEWEQGGAMPSPDYPSEVESCGDNINLFDKSTTTDGKYINNSGFEETQSDAMHSDYIQIELNKDFYISGRNDWASIALYDKNKAFLERIATTKPNGILNITNSNCKYIIINALLVDKETLKIEKGSIPTQYSPYGQGCINEVICNKNLFNVSILNDYSQNGLTLIKNKGTNKIKLNGTPSADFTIYSKDFDINKLKIGSTYSLSKDFDNITFNFEVFENNSNTASVWKKSITMQKSYTRVRVYVQGKANTTFNNQEIALQLEKGNATEIVAHQSQTYIIPTQQPFRAVRDIRDTFIKKNNKWFERHYIFRKIFDGTETFTKETRNEVTNFYMSLEGFGSQKGYCNILPVVNNDSYIANILFIWSNLNGFSMMFDTSRFGTLSDYKSYLKSLYDAGTPAYLDYVLKEPLDIECTEEQSTILFDIEQNAKTYDKVTHMYSTDEVSANIEVTYKKDIETLFANTLVEGV